MLYCVKNNKNKKEEAIGNDRKEKHFLGIYTYIYQYLYSTITVNPL